MNRRHHTRRARSALFLLLALGSVVAPVGAAAAGEPNGHASCVGLEEASISPPGSSDEEPGGARQFIGEVKEFAAALGARPGTLMSFIAQLRAGSHEDCDEALGG